MAAGSKSTPVHTGGGGDPPFTVRDDTNIENYKISEILYFRLFSHNFIEIMDIDISESVPKASITSLPKLIFPSNLIGKKKAI